MDIKIRSALNTLAFVLTSLLSSSQELQTGFRFGISIPDIKGNTEQSKGYTSRLAPYFGINLNKRLTSCLNIQTEINYSPQGGQRNGLQPINASEFGGTPLPPDIQLYANYDNETRINYLEVPLLFQFYTEDEQKSKERVLFYQAGIGPYMAVRIKAVTITSGTSQVYLDDKGEQPLILQDGSALPPQNFNSKTNIKDEIRTFNAGVVGAIGMGYKFDEHKFFAEARFTRGFTNIQTHPEINGKNQTGSLIFSVGYTYCIPTKKTITPHLTIQL